MSNEKLDPLEVATILLRDADTYIAVGSTARYGYNSTRDRLAKRISDFLNEHEPKDATRNRK